MKTLIILGALLIGQLALTKENDFCLNAATQAMENMLNHYLDETPGSQSPNGITSIKKVPVTESLHSHYSAQAEIISFINHGDDNYEGKITINLELDKKCSLISHDLEEDLVYNSKSMDENLRETIVKLLEEQNSYRQMPCHQEMALQCKDGYIDSCIQSPKAEIHQCVPELSDAK